MARFILTSAALAVLLSSASTTHAFTTPAPTFVPRTHHSLPATYVNGRGLLDNSRRRTASTTTTALQMNLFDRFSRVAKSNLNNVLKSLEDPEKIMNQALEDMQVRMM
jgi:hypothetical protein